MKVLDQGARLAFLTVWLAVCFFKVLIAAELPLFVDEAFYWQESRHLAWAYSDLPGLTAWLIHLGTSLGGHHLLGMRWPFLLIASALPWMVRAMTRPLGEHQAWLAALITTLFPLSGLLGVMALPDVPMAFAAAACVLGGVRLVQKVDRWGVFWLALGLVLGGLAHYRFVAVIGVGFMALLLLKEGRVALKRPAVWLAVSLGAMAWLPLIFWNLSHGDAGWRFQFVDRHPWAFHSEGFLFVLIQALIATPAVFAAMVWGAWRGLYDSSVVRRWLALSGGLSLLSFFLLGFVADSERVSFHWTLPGYLALLPLLPSVLQQWSKFWRGLAYGVLVLAFIIAVIAHGLIATSGGRDALAQAGYYPENFAGWESVAEAVRAKQAEMPEEARLIVDNFKLGAELGFALNNPDIFVLDHPLNHRHGRAQQLALWDLIHEGQRESWQLLVVAASDVKFSGLLMHYQSLCARFGELPVPEVIDIDQGKRRFLMFALPPRKSGEGDAPCITPSVAHIDLPTDGAMVSSEVLVRGWAVKDFAGIAAVRILLDGQVIAEAKYGLTNEWPATFLKGQSKDPNLPRVQFEGVIQLPESAQGELLLGVELVGGDGSIERWSNRRIHVVH